MVKKIEKEKKAPQKKVESKTEAPKPSAKSGLNFHEHISKFFANPHEFFEKTANESFFESVKYFGLFFLLIVLSNLFMGKPSDIGWGMYAAVLFGSLAFIYTVIPFLLNISGKLAGIKTKFSKVLSLYFYVTCYFFTISIILRVLVSSVQLLLQKNIYFNFFVTAFSVYLLVLLFTAFVFYMTAGLKNYFGSEGRRPFYAMMIFFTFLFILVLIASFVFIWVISSGYQA